MPKSVYTLQVFITGGPMTEEFIEANDTISRTIEIRGDQTLERLHEAIFQAFDRFDEHMYEFQFGKGPHDPEGDRYTGAAIAQDPFDPDAKPAGIVESTRIEKLGLEAGQSFGYWFDFGDDWYHKIDVLAIGEAEPGVKYPRVTDRTGDSPPQYVDWDDEDEDYDEDDEDDEGEDE
jgi:hypothetical protein